MSLADEIREALGRRLAEEAMGQIATVKTSGPSQDAIERKLVALFDNAERVYAERVQQHGRHGYDLLVWLKPANKRAGRHAMAHRGYKKHLPETGAGIWLDAVGARDYAETIQAGLRTIPSQATVRCYVVKNLRRHFDVGLTDAVTQDAVA